MSTPNVFRDQMKQGRTGYFVTYQPADCRYPFALIDLVFLDDPVDHTHACRAMESELKVWLELYAVPVMVSAFDPRESLIHVRGYSGESHLLGYRDSKTGKLVQRWGLFKEDELPSEHTKPEYLQSVYRDVSFRVQKLWNYPPSHRYGETGCNILRDDGLSFHLRQGYGRQDGDYVERLTILLFLTMADEQLRPPFNQPSFSGFGGTGKPSAVPKDYAWPSLLARAGRNPFVKAFTENFYD
jgi:hypothetical protein